MELGVLSDIHGNYEAFKACVDYLEKRKVDAYVLLGDYIGELPCPQKTLDLVRNLQKTRKCYVLRGNKEDYILQGLGGFHPEWNEYKSIVGMLRYGFDHCTEEDRKYFENLPITDVISIEGYPDVRICHGSVDHTKRKIELEPEEVIKNIREDYILCGHTHRKKETHVAGKHIFNPGSVGIQIDGDIGAGCMILHGSLDSWEPEFLLIPYDVEAEIQSMRDEGLFSIAPYWSIITEQLLRGGNVYHSKVLNYAVELCTRERGSCTWPEIPEDYMRRAVDVLINKK